MAEKWITAEEHEKHVDDEIYKFMEVVPRGSPPEKIKSKLSAYKGQFTKTENLARAQLEDVHSLDIEDYNSTLRNTLYNIKNKHHKSGRQHHIIYKNKKWTSKVKIWTTEVGGR